MRSRRSNLNTWFRSPRPSPSLSPQRVSHVKGHNSEWWATTRLCLWALNQSNCLNSIKNFCLYNKLLNIPFTNHIRTRVIRCLCIHYSNISCRWIRNVFISNIGTSTLISKENPILTWAEILVAACARVRRFPCDLLSNSKFSS